MTKLLGDIYKKYFCIACTVLGIFQLSSTVIGIVLVLRKLKPTTGLGCLAKVILKCYECVLLNF